MVNTTVLITLPMSGRLPESTSPSKIIRMRPIREAKGISLRALSLRVGIAHADLSLVERGIRPCWPGWRRRLVRVLQVPADELFAPANENESRRA